MIQFLDYIAKIDFNRIIIWTLSFCGVIQILDLMGLLPEMIAKYIYRNRFETTLNALKKIGVKVEWPKPDSSSIVNKIFTTPEYKTQARLITESSKHEGPTTVGHSTHHVTNHFIDLIGESSDPKVASECAKLLNTHIQNFHTPILFDAVATPKLGSPLIGYEFSKIKGKPLILGVHQKCNSKNMGAHENLDFPKSLTLKDSKIIIVDDSTTGGRKVIDLASELKKHGATVEDVLVLFKPEGKKAEKKLLEAGLKLHYIISEPQSKIY